jgi:putative spermidine/putrescine transport system substrate-binding protein/spermidine/putrescine transport system substrate-binding protein
MKIGMGSGRAACLLAAGVAGTLMAAGAASAAGEVNLLTWEGYADDSFAKPFEAETGCKVTATYVGSNDEFVAKILAGGGVYDLVSPSNDTTRRLIDADAVEPIDVARVPNMQHFFDIFLKAPWNLKDGKTYGVPHGWGIMRIVVDTEATGGKTPDSLAFLWDPSMAGKVSIWDDVEAIYTASRYLGFKNTYDLDDGQLEKVKEALLKLKPNIRKYWTTTGEMGTLMASREVAAGNAWETTLVDLWKAKRKAVDVDPREGRSAWSDSWMIVKGGGKNPCAYKWLDYTAAAKTQALAHAVTGYGYSNSDIVKELTGEVKDRYVQLHLSDPEILKTVDWWQPVARRAKYLEIWTQVKATE